jgi:hypothetical protein
MMTNERSLPLLDWLKDFFLNFGTIFAGFVGALISGVTPVVYPKFNAKLGYSITAIVSLLIGSYRSYRKMASHVNTLEHELAQIKTRRQCSIKLIRIGQERRQSTIANTELLAIDAEIHVRNGDLPTTILLSNIEPVGLPTAKLSGSAYWALSPDQPVRTQDLVPGQQFLNVLHCVFLIPKDQIGSTLEIEYTFDETYQGSIIVTGCLSFPAMAW